MKKMLGICILATTAVVVLSNCSSGSSSPSGTTNLTTAGKMTTGLSSAIETMQSIGGAMGTQGGLSVQSAGNVHAATAALKCTSHGEPGADGHNGQPVDGEVTDMEKYNSTDPQYALQKFYCALAADTDGPESVSGSVRQIKTIVCAIERTVGTLAFNNVAVPITTITFDSACATPAEIADMGSSITIPGGATVTAALNPTFPDAPGNTHYTHGIKIESNTAGLLKFIVLAKFDASVAGDPVESGNFEFATLGTGSFMQGSAIEYTAGKISGGAVTTRNLWYESRINRVKSSGSDPICQPGDPAAGSCGFARHTRLKTDISFNSSGDIDTVTNLTGIISDAGDDVGSGQNNQMSIVTATGSLSTGLTGKAWDGAGTSPVTLTSGDTVADLTARTTTCLSASVDISTSCVGFPAAYIPTEPIKAFFLPPNTTTWLANASTKGGLGFTSATNAADSQFVNP